jgi:citrate synthase
MDQDSDQLVSAREAARRLGVGLPTLYAYVSRGLVRSEPDPGGSAAGRTRRYRLGDIERLAARRGEGRSRARIAQAALEWGTPVLDSALTLIKDGRLFYRGHDAAALARSAALEDVALLLWGDAAAGCFAPANLPPAPRLPHGGATAFAPVDRCIVAAALAAPADAAALDRSPAGVARCGARLLRLMAAASVGARPGADPAHVVLARGWRRPNAAAAIRQALVLYADHELNASAFTARCAASTAATPYAALIAALAALTGPRHGGATRKVEILLDLPAVARDPAEAVAERLRLGEELPGFGHALYPEGDPRGAALLACADALSGGSGRAVAALRQAHAVAAAARRLTGARPNVDFGLVALCRRLDLPPGSPLAIFLVGRTIGWIAHALEQYASPRLIRPRARYVGPPPELSVQSPHAAR